MSDGLKIMHCSRDESHHQFPTIIIIIIDDCHISRSIVYLETFGYNRKSKKSKRATSSLPDYEYSPYHTDTVQYLNRLPTIRPMGVKSTGHLSQAFQPQIQRSV